MDQVFTVDVIDKINPVRPDIQPSGNVYIVLALIERNPCRRPGEGTRAPAPQTDRASVYMRIDLGVPCQAKPNFRPATIPSANYISDLVFIRLIPVCV